HGRPPEGVQSIPAEYHEKNQGEVHEIAVQVLKQKRPVVLAPVALTRLTDGAGGWVRPEGTIICLAVVVAGEAKQAGKCQDEEPCRERRPGGQPSRPEVRLDPGMRALRIVNQRRKKRRKIGSHGRIVRRVKIV